MPYLLERTQRISRPPGEVFEFFADAFNLEEITPPWLNFRVTTPRPIEMGPGTLISYRLRMRGLPLRWVSEIRDWEPGVRFSDVQVRGPYSLWEHTHTFEPDGEGGTLIGDRISYALPLGPLGRAAHPLVQRDLKRIFDYRAEQISSRLSSGPAASAEAR